MDDWNSNEKSFNNNLVIVSPQIHNPQFFLQRMEYILG